MRCKARGSAVLAAATLGTVLALSACAPALRVPPRPAAPPVAFEARAIPTGSTTAPSASIPDAWWREFRDPQLDDLVQTALGTSTTIRLARARIEEARALRRQTRSATGPSGSLTASGTRQGSEAIGGSAVDGPATNTGQVAFSPAWEVDLFGRLDAQRARADADAAAAGLDFEGVRLALAADVASALFQARLTAAQLETAQTNLDIAQQLARSARIGFERGLNSGQDLSRLEADAATASAEVERLGTELDAAKRSLLILIGRPDAPTASLPLGGTQGIAPSLPAVTPAVLLARRPDVRSSAAALRSAVLGARGDRLALFPRFTLQAGIGTSATSLAGGGASAFWSIASGLSAPVLDRARLLAAMHAGEARALQAAIRYEKAVQTAYGEAENALARVHSGQQRSRDLDAAAGHAEDALRRARAGYQAGVTDLTTLLQVQRTWLQARNARDAGRTALLVDTVSAFRALGGGWDEQASEVADLIDLEPTENAP